MRGGDRHAGGGGAGGYREGTTPSVISYTASPLVAPTGLTVTFQGYPITVGGGGAGGNCNPGANSVFSTITSAGGGGADQNAPSTPGGDGVVEEVDVTRR